MCLKLWLEILLDRNFRLVEERGRGDWKKKGQENKPGSTFALLALLNSRVCTASLPRAVRLQDEHGSSPVVYRAPKASDGIFFWTRVS